MVPGSITFPIISTRAALCMANIPPKSCPFDWYRPTCLRTDQSNNTVFSRLDAAHNKPQQSFVRLSNGPHTCHHTIPGIILMHIQILNPMMHATAPHSTHHTSLDVEHRRHRFRAPSSSSACRRLRFEIHLPSSYGRPFRTTPSSHAGQSSIRMQSAWLNSAGLPTKRKGL